MHIKGKVIKGRDVSYMPKNGGPRVDKYVLTCSDPDETLLDNFDVTIPWGDVSKVGPDGSLVRGKMLEVTVESLREGFNRMEFTGPTNLYDLLKLGDSGLTAPRAVK